MADENDTQTEPAPVPAESTPVAANGITRLGSDSPASVPGQPLTGGQGKKIVRTRWPIDTFEHGLKGVPVITAHGVEIDASKAKALNDKAAEAGIELEEVPED